MLCEHYKDALIEAAAGGATPSGELRAHLAECVPCRAAFAQEQSLFAGIDSSLHAAANAEVPPSLLPRVRARLDESTVPNSRWVRSLVLASASVAFALAVFLLAHTQHTAPEEVAKLGPGAVPTPAAPSKVTNPGKTSSDATKVTAVRVGHSHASRNSANPHFVASSNPEVLVPPGTEAAFLSSLPRLLKDFEPSQQGQGGQAKSLEIAPLAIDEISSSPLSPDEKDSGPNGG
jgi:predicted anti-sigma-YlaC factor YlaD